MSCTTARGPGPAPPRAPRPSSRRPSRGSWAPRGPGRDHRQRLERLLEGGPQEEVRPPSGPDQVRARDPELLDRQPGRLLDVLDRLDAAVGPTAAQAGRRGGPAPAAPPHVTPPLPPPRQNAPHGVL